MLLAQLEKPVYKYDVSDKEALKKVRRSLEKNRQKFQLKHEKKADEIHA